jgi:hypothetical protein
LKSVCEKLVMNRTFRFNHQFNPTDHEAARTNALTLFGILIGTLQLARALTDRDLSDQLLARGAETALRLLDERA